MKIKSSISILLGGLLLSLVALTNVMAEEMTWLNTYNFIAGENVMISHGSPEFPGSIKVQNDNNDGLRQEGEIITRFKIKKDYELTSVSLCLRGYTEAPEFAVNIYKLGVPPGNLTYVETDDPVGPDTPLRSSDSPAFAVGHCTNVSLAEPIMSKDETLLLGVALTFIEDNDNAVISAVGLGQTSTYFMIEDCNTGISGIDGTLSDLITGCLPAKNHGRFVSCVSKAANRLKKAKTISGSQKGQITSCAAQSSLP